MVLIWALSSLSHVNMIDVDDFPLRDKGAHFIEYTGLAVLVAYAAFRTWPDRAVLRVLLAAVIITTGWGVLDEFHQAFVPERSPDPADALADLLGAITGASLCGFVYVVRRRKGAAELEPSP